MIHRIYTDDSAELKRAVKDLDIPSTVHDRSTPGMPQTNGIAENQVRRVINGTRVLLASAGLPVACSFGFGA